MFNSSSSSLLFFTNLEHFPRTASAWHYSGHPYFSKFDHNWYERKCGHYMYCSVAIPDPGSGMGKKTGSRSGIRIRDEQPGSYFRELRNQLFGLKYLNNLMRIRELGWKNFGSGIRDGKHLDSGSGIWDEHPGSATLMYCLTVYCIKQFMVL